MAGPYTVQSGDSLSKIGSQFGLNYNDIAKWNNIADPNKIRAGQVLQLSGPQAQTPAPTAAAQPSYVPSPAKLTPFSQVLPYDKIFNPDQVNQLAYSQVAPDIQRAQSRDLATTQRAQAGNGSYRTGSASQQLQDLQDHYSRQLKEQTQQFGGELNDYASTWYNQQAQNYETSPSTYVQPTLPTFEDFMKTNPALGSAYSNFIK